MRGVRDPLDLEERLVNRISDLVTPRLVPELEILPWRRTQVLAVQVYPSPSRPERPTPELDSEALDFRTASESLAPVRKLSRADLETLRLVAVHHGRKVPDISAATSGQSEWSDDTGQGVPGNWDKRREC